MASTTASARSICKPTSTSSRSASTGGSTHSTHSARCSVSQAVCRRRPTPTYIPALGPTLYVVGVCINRIGTQQTIPPIRRFRGSYRHHNGRGPCLPCRRAERRSQQELSRVAYHYIDCLHGDCYRLAGHRDD